MTEEYEPEIKNKLWQAFQDWNDESLLLESEISGFLDALEGRGLKLVEVK